MTLKALAQGKFRGANAALASNGVETVTLYTAGAGKKAYIKELRTVIRGNNAAVQIVFYVLKSGGTDMGSLSGNQDPFAGGAAESYLGGAQPILSVASNVATATQTVALNTVLETGDALKMAICNNTGGNINCTTFGANLTATGDES